jgi:hypothetical protein
MPWADSTNRQVAIYKLKLERANEECCRLNVEIQRLVTSMRDEEAELSQHIEALGARSPWLAAELTNLLARRVQMNDVHRTQLQEIFALSSYNGVRVPGTRVGQIAGDAEISDLQQPSSRLDDGNMGGEDIYAPDEDDFIGEQLDGLATYLENLSLVDE